ncbi:hypothetical protein scyTo_0012264 [Scyliorhinus torazame]|uniref:Uncharacterized protein n=1 Tax=Scyliorhinus torazame TaxID=75743 RepID=A0A401P5F4_SCYTO|nr:hypothetical protein [Scyliorhinus torazame]
MGNNAYGQCGRRIVDSEIYSSSQIIHQIDDLDNNVVEVNVPKHLPFKGVGKIKQAARGGTHAAILNREGNVFV